MTLDTTVLPDKQTAISRKLWTAPRIQVLDINAAEGAQAGPLCDKHGSLSGTLGNDRCDPSTK